MEPSESDRMKVNDIQWMVLQAEMAHLVILYPTTNKLIGCVLKCESYEKCANNSDHMLRQLDILCSGQLVFHKETRRYTVRSIYLRGVEKHLLVYEC